jgi:hypothetical protein
MKSKIILVRCETVGGSTISTILMRREQITLVGDIHNPKPNKSPELSR